MIYLIHKNNKVIQIYNAKFKPLHMALHSSITDTLFVLANTYPKEVIVWCHKAYVDGINKTNLSNIFHHKRLLVSYNLGTDFYIDNAIGFVDQSVYIKVNKGVTFPTWRMSSDIGGMHAVLLTTQFKNVNRYKHFDYFLNALAKLAMPQGLFCYSEPNLLKDNSIPVTHVKKSSNHHLFKFVKQHYKIIWVFVLFYSFIVHKKKLPLIAFLSSFFYKKNKDDLNFIKTPIQSSKQLITKKEIDVVIPTIGRKQYLYNVLKDLSVQTVLPKNVIIIEQNTNTNAKSELDYLTLEKWPFTIKHKFIHQSGVCNARNIGMDLVESEWTFLGDDDNRFDMHLIENVFNEIKSIGAKAISTVYLKPNEEQTYLKTSQTSIFGGGNSFIKSDLLENLKFDTAFEFNYGEDSDFGMQIRNLGEDVIFCSNIKITHLKAPIGGYRIMVRHPWSSQLVTPKPSPTIMLFNKKNLTRQQLLTYKLLLYIKFYKRQNIKNPFRYISTMKKSWKASELWAYKLSK